jgi:hypothetical protein
VVSLVDLHLADKRHIRIIQKNVARLMLLHVELLSSPFYMLVCDVTNSQDFLIIEELINYDGKIQVFFHILSYQDGKGAVIQPVSLIHPDPFCQIRNFRLDPAIHKSFYMKKFNPFLLIP